MDAEAEASKKWGDRYINAAKRIIKKTYSDQIEIAVTSDKLDQEENSDLIMLETDAPIFKGKSRIAFRMRAFDVWLKYRDEFTIRSKVHFSPVTEIHKIIKGQGDLFLYAFAVADDNEDEIHYWRLIDLDVFRYAVATTKIPFFTKTNYGRNPTDFNVYNVNDFPRMLKLVVAEGPGVRVAKLKLADEPPPWNLGLFGNR